MKQKLIAIFVLASLTMAGCASVPMASEQDDAASKAFTLPPSDKAGLYVYRDSFTGKSIKRTVSLDGAVIGATANKVYFYKLISPGSHTLSTESEFGDNSITFQALGGHNYFARQYMKMGAFTAGAGIKIMDEDEGEKEVLRCDRAQ
ncbi:MAG: DUF2846 domain-containing protein [Betaproteobacteria bacterium]|nr:DUF2846 domain-containing protein [Betaproteobacteria bacterium]